jgi:hypothetical protein
MPRPTRATPRPSRRQLPFRPTARLWGRPTTCSTAATTWTSTPTSTSRSPCPMRCRSSAWRPATTTRNTARMPAAWSTSSPRAEPTSIMATRLNSSATAPSTPPTPSLTAPALNSKVVDPLNRNQFGGTVGGPLEIPHLFRSDKSFGFFGYQRTINHAASRRILHILLPTIAQAGANSSGGAPGTNNLVFTRASWIPLIPTEYLYGSRCGVSAAPSGGGTAVYASSHTWKPSALSPVTLRNSLKAMFRRCPPGAPLLLPQPNNFTRGRDHGARRSGDYAERQIDGAVLLRRIHPARRGKHREHPDLADGASNHYYNSLISETHTFSDHIVNNFIISYQIQNDSAGRSQALSTWPTLASPVCTSRRSSRSIRFSRSQLFHQLHARAGHLPQRELHADRRYPLPAGPAQHRRRLPRRGVEGRCRITSSLPGQFNFSPTGTGDSAASFLFGYLFQMNQATASFFKPRGKFQGAYVQDSWKATPRLTLDYGVRWEPFVPWHERDGRMGSFNPTLWASNTHSTKYPLRRRECSSLAIQVSTPTASRRLTATSCPGWALPGMSSATAKPACAAAPACSLTAASTAPFQYLLQRRAVPHFRGTVLHILGDQSSCRHQHDLHQSIRPRAS